MNRFSHLAAYTVLAFVELPAVAQTGLSPSSQPSSASAVQDAGGSLAIFDNPQPGVANAVTAADLVRDADRCRDFSAAHPGDAAAPEARRREAIFLLRAAFQGDTTQKARCDELVALVRTDTVLPIEERFDVASFADHRSASLQSFASEAARRAQFEAIAQALVKEFPSVQETWAAMLRLAQDCEEDRAHRLLDTLLGSAQPSPEIMAGAQSLLDRLALVGKPLEPLLKAGLQPAATPAIAKGSPVILYTWSASCETSLLLAATIAQQAPTGATILGINLDSDTSSARDTAKARQLPGTQLYDKAGTDSRIAQQLKLTSPSIIFIADRQGAIRTVNGRVDLSAQLDSASR